MEEDLYLQHILEHYKSPQNKEVLANATHSAQGANPLCGDDLTIYLTVDTEERISEAAFDGDGCAISVAAASMLTETLKGKTRSEVTMLTPGDIYNMLGIQIGPSRVNCALLAYKAVNDALGSGK